MENQAALGGEHPVARKDQQLMGEGLSRHDAIDAIGSVLMEQLLEVMQGRATGGLNEAYLRDWPR